MKQCTNGRCFAAGSSIHCWSVFQSYILRDFLCRIYVAWAALNKRNKHVLLESVRLHRGVHSSGRAKNGHRYFLMTRVGYCLEPAGFCPVCGELSSKCWPVVCNHHVTVCQLFLSCSKLWDAFPQADSNGSHFLHWQHYH